MWYSYELLNQYDSWNRIRIWKNWCGRFLAPNYSMIPVTTSLSLSQAFFTSAAPCGTISKRFVHFKSSYCLDMRNMHISGLFLLPSWPPRPIKKCSSLKPKPISIRSKWHRILFLKLISQGTIFTFFCLLPNGETITPAKINTFTVTRSRTPSDRNEESWWKFHECFTS